MISYPNIDLPLTIDALESRSQRFKQELINITSYHHQKYLEKLPVMPRFNISQFKSWHVGFKLQEVPDIEEGELPPKPQISTIKIFKNSNEKNILSKNIGE